MSKASEAEQLKEQEILWYKEHKTMHKASKIIKKVSISSQFLCTAQIQQDITYTLYRVS